MQLAPACLSTMEAAARESALVTPSPHPQANAVTGLGQPALLYLCPLTLGAVLATAATRKEVGRIWGFTDTSAAPHKPKDGQAGGEQQQQEKQQ